MADDPAVPAADPAVPPVEPVVVVPPDPPAHPLAPGGVRFEEVYREAKQAKSENQDLRERLARLEGAAAVKPAAEAPKFYTPQQLQGMVDRAEITPAIMADQLAWQRASEARRATLDDVKTYERAQGALREVEQYLAKLPALHDRSSSDFTRVAQAARDIAQDTGREVSDPVVQRLALRATYGPLDRLAAAAQTREAARQQTDPFAESGGGGGQHASTPTPLKDVPKEYLEHWKTLGYTQAQMIEEAAFVRRTPRRVMR